jgi:hypothetical protein
MSRKCGLLAVLAFLLSATSGCGLLCDRYCERAHDRCDRYRDRCAPVTGCYPAPTAANNYCPPAGVYSAPAPAPYCP